MPKFSDFRPKKRLGQNFLTSEAIIKEMVDAARVRKGDTILEIGPGKGIITRELLARGARVTAIEKDPDLVELLNTTFPTEIARGMLEVIEDDALSCSLENKTFSGNKYKIVANIPYYITGRFLRIFLETPHKPESITVIIQKEVANRIVRRDSKGSILSESVRAYGVPQYIRTIPARYFKPQPDVDSAILTIDGIAPPPFAEKRSEETFFKALKAGFAHKRKYLSSNLAAHFDKEKTQVALRVCSIDEKARPEDLSHDTWLCLAENLS